jgi:hypothetical protein
LLLDKLTLFGFCSLAAMSLQHYIQLGTATTADHFIAGSKIPATTRALGMTQSGFFQNVAYNANTHTNEHQMLLCKAEQPAYTSLSSQTHQPAVQPLAPNMLLCYFFKYLPIHRY